MEQIKPDCPNCQISAGGAHDPHCGRQVAPPAGECPPFQPYQFDPALGGHDPTVDVRPFDEDDEAGWTRQFYESDAQDGAEEGTCAA